MSDTRPSNPDVEAIHRLYEKWFGAMERGDVSGVLDSLADDFVLKSPSRPAVSSRAVLRRGLDESYAAYTERVRYKIEEVEVLGDQAWARVSEETTLVARKGGKEYSISGMHLAILARQPDGSWKVKREVSSLDHE